MASDCIDVIIPTYNRLWALQRVVEFYLQRQEVRRVILVDDGSTDGTWDWISGEASRNGRLVALRHARNRGASASRNTGADAADAPFAFFADDDMLFTPADGLAFMLEEMKTHEADIAAPIHVFPESRGDRALPTVVRSYAGVTPMLYQRGTLELRPRTVVAEWSLPRSLATSLGCAWMLMRRHVLEKVRYDEGLGVTGYRDETDFQLKALREGFRLRACSRPVMIDLARERDKGGCHSTSRAEYVWRAYRNNWRILVRHEQVIREGLGIRAPILWLHVCFVFEHGL